MVLYANSFSLYEQPRRGICHERHEHRSCKFFLGTGKIFKIPNQFLEVRYQLYTKLPQASKKTFNQEEETIPSHHEMICYKLDSPRLSKLQSKKDLLHPNTYLDWWEKYVCNDFSFKKQIVFPISNWDVSIGDIYFLREWNHEFEQSFKKTSRGWPLLFLSVLLQRSRYMLLCLCLCLCVFVSLPLCVCVNVFVSMSLSLSLCVWSSFELGERLVERREAPPPAALICPATVPAVFAFVYLSLPLSFACVFEVESWEEPPQSSSSSCSYLSCCSASRPSARAAAPLTGFSRWLQVGLLRGLIIADRQPVFFLVP